MTTLALQGLSLHRLSKFFKKIIERVTINIMIARQIQANQEIARCMVQHGEYKTSEHTYHSLLAQLNDRTISRINEEYKSNG